MKLKLVFMIKDLLLRLIASVYRSAKSYYPQTPL